MFAWGIKQKGERAAFDNERYIISSSHFIEDPAVLVQVLLNLGVGGWGESGSLEAPLLILTLHTLQCTAQFFI